MLKLFITLGIAYFIYDKFFKVAYRKGDEYFTIGYKKDLVKRDVSIAKKEEVLNNTTPIPPYYSMSISRDVYGYNLDGFSVMRGLVKVYNTKREYLDGAIYPPSEAYNNRVYLDGLVTPGEVNWACTPSTVFLCSIHHVDQLSWSDDKGTYEALTYKATVPMVNGGKVDVMKPACNYFTYKPSICHACGDKLTPLPKPMVNVDGVLFGTVNTGAMPDSRDRYCDECNEILDRKTGTFYPFYIDHLYHEFISYAENPNKFMNYIEDLRGVKRVINKKPEEINIKDSNANAYREREQHEYTKNIEMFEIWDRLKGCA